MPKSYFPPRTLKEALEVPRTIFDKNAGNPMARLRLAESLGLPPEGRILRELITASSQYGLTSGSYKSQKITLEEAGRAICREDIGVAYDALFAIPLFRDFHTYFAGGGSRSVPSDKVAMDFLKNEQGVPERQLASAFRGIIQNARDWHVIQNFSGVDRLVNRDLALERATSEQVPQPDRPTPAATDPSAGDMVTLQPGSEMPSTVRIAPNVHLNIEIHISADMPVDKIEAIFKNMRDYLLADEQ